MGLVHNLDVYPHTGGRSCLGCVWENDAPDPAADETTSTAATFDTSDTEDGFFSDERPPEDDAGADPETGEPPPALISASIETDLVRRRGEPTVLSARALGIADDTAALFRVFERGCEACPPIAIVEGVVHDEEARAEWDGRIPAGVGDELTMTVGIEGLVSEAVPVPIESVRHTIILELHDALFRLKSAVLMPEGEAPAQDASEHKSLTTVGIVSTLLRFVQEHPGRKALVAGHTDTAGTESYNQRLSEERAACARACVTGDREAFVAVCDGRHRAGDYKQILSWAARQFGFDCDPGKIDNEEFSGIKPVKRFQKAYNETGHAGTGNPDIDVDGDVGPQTWGAFFDCYEQALRAELGVDDAGLAALRANLVFLPAPGPSVGCGEHHPIDEVGRDGYRSQTNRRVEVLLFDPGEEPQLPCHAGGACDPSQCDLYNSLVYERVHLPPMISAQPWTARFELEGDASIHADTRLVLDAPGLPAGETIVFEVFQEGKGSVGFVETTSEEGRASTSFEDWLDETDAPERVMLEAGQPFPEMRFFFEARGGGRTLTAATAPYGDFLDGVLRLGDAPIPNADYAISGPYGSRFGRTDASGHLREEGLPPGGVTFLFGVHLLRDETGAPP